MRSLLVRLVLVVSLASGALPEPVRASGTSTATSGDSSAIQVQHRDPCLFYRSQAWHRELAHFSQDMLWSCEAIEQRRRAGVQLGDRLTAADFALRSYRERVIETARSNYRMSVLEGLETFHRRVTESQKRAIAEETGALAAMEALNHGF